MWSESAAHRDEVLLRSLHTCFSTTPASQCSSRAWKGWTELEAELPLDAGATGPWAQREGWGMTPPSSCPGILSALTARCWQSLKAAFHFSKGVNTQTPRVGWMRSESERCRLVYSREREHVLQLWVTNQVPPHHLELTTGGWSPRRLPNVSQAMHPHPDCVHSHIGGSRPRPCAPLVPSRKCPHGATLKHVLRHQYLLFQTGASMCLRICPS